MTPWRRPDGRGAALLRTHDRGAASALAQLLRAGPRGRVAAGSPWTTTRWPAAADDVADVTRGRYPDLDIPLPQPLAPLRGRRRGPARRARRAARRRRRPRACPRDDRPDRGERAARRRRRRRLAVSSSRTAAGSRRSEGLASRAGTRFVAGLFSSDPDRAAAGRRGGAARARPPIAWPRRSRSAPANPLVGLDGPRVRCCAGSATRWPTSPRSSARRPTGGLFDASSAPSARRSTRTTCSSLLLTSLSRIWPAGNIDRRRAAGRLLAPRRRRRARPDRGLAAVPQAVAVADLLAARAVRVGRRHGRRTSTR